MMCWVRREELARAFLSVLTLNNRHIPAICSSSCAVSR
jgi:hypothetical protein